MTQFENALETLSSKTRWKPSMRGSMPISAWLAVVLPD